MIRSNNAFQVVSSDVPVRRGFEAWFICPLGRLDLHAGEIVHFRTSWVDWNRKLVRLHAT